MTNLILAEMTASVTELKKDPMGTVAAGEGFPVAILNRNAPAFYCIPAKTYEAMMERLEDAALNAIADARQGQPVVKVRSMSYELGFLDEALKEWRALDGGLREQFKRKLAERLETPRVPAAKLSGHKDRYKIKLRSAGYRLVYEVRDRELIVVVVAAGRRDRNAVYKVADKR